tara:strand:+ start:299 stop:1096 length:798 start_codon:yes stop_codon:yes gene_type:complete
MKNLTAVIPCRAGSQRVPNKNFKPFYTHTLLDLKIQMLMTLPVDRIIVNTNSRVGIEIANNYGVEYIRRPEYFASSECTNSEYHEYLAKSTMGENIFIAQVTSPLVSKESYEEAINIFFERQVDSLISVRDFKNFIIHKGKPVNYDLYNMPNSQDLPSYKIPTFGIVICKRKTLQEERNYICGNTYFYNLSEIEAIDIDSPLDFEMAEFLYRKRANPYIEKDPTTNFGDKLYSDPQIDYYQTIDAGKPEDGKGIARLTNNNKEKS